MKTVTREQKHLSMNASDLGKCFMRIEDVLEICPKFIPKRIYDKIDEKGHLTTEQYVKCKHVKESVSDDDWKKIKTEIVFDWFRLGRDSDIRLVLNTGKGTIAIASSDKTGNFALASSDDGSSVKAEVISPDGEKLTAEIKPSKKVD